ncbi:MAG: penicillin acylase family protein [Gammaproteobacteria bacterium]
MYVGYVLQASRLPQDDTLAIRGLTAPVEVEFDALGIPRIQAQSRVDAFLALGFVTGRERLFQMDLQRRRAAGRLAEVFGAGLIESDRWYRVMGFEQVASAVLALLSQEQRAAVHAYAEGVNKAIAQFRALPFEFHLLRYAPEPWRPEDCLLVVLDMYAGLGFGLEGERGKRAVTTMRGALPKEVADFLTPKGDQFTEKLFQTSDPRFAPAALPIKKLAMLLHEQNERSRRTSLDFDEVLNRGSNAWVVGPSKTRDGRAIVANDMHLDLSVPNIWYRAELHYGNVWLAGLTLPGVPLIVIGSTQHIAWGFTGGGVDVADLVLVDVNPKNATEYTTKEGNRRFGERIESIRVHGAIAETVLVRTTQWGPILTEPLLGKPVAIRWTALDPSATNLDYMDLDGVRTVQEALRRFNRAGGPPLNALVADAEGNIGWTLTGRAPIRFGIDGLSAFSWANEDRGWRGYIPPENLPRVVNPRSGFVVNANQRMVDSRYPYVISHGYASGYRAYRIVERLRQMEKITESDMLGLQLDTQADFYRYYQDLALKVLEVPEVRTQPDAATLGRYLKAWDGRAEPHSLGLPLLVEFREALLEAVFSPILARCAEVDPKFQWNTADVALMQLVDAKHPDLLANRDDYPHWDAFIWAVLERSAKRIMDHYRVDSLADLTWGQTDETRIAHPLSGAIPLLGHLLDMPRLPLPGCTKCVRTARYAGATERLVVSPGHGEDGILHMPGGQSGHPLSPHYRDQHLSWAQGVPVPLWAGAIQHRLIFEPAAAREVRRP